MKRSFTFVALVLSTAFTPAAHAAPDTAYFTLKSGAIEEITESAPALGQSVSSLDLGEVKEGLVILDQIVNLGKKVWDLVAANQPVVNVDAKSANALPQGVTGWDQLERWSTPVTKLYRLHYENAYGITVVDFTYRVVYTPGGQVGGRGRYLAGVTAMPASLRVLWGYKFDMQAAIPQVLNVNTKADPIAAAQLQLNWKVHNILMHDEGSTYYVVRGDGGFSDLSQLR
jgi:hypothetical protein